MNLRSLRRKAKGATHHRRNLYGKLSKLGAVLQVRRDHGFQHELQVRTCFRCGFTQHWKPARNPDGTPKVDAEGHNLDDVYSEKIGYGSAQIRLAEGVGRLTTFNAPLTESGELSALFGEIPEDYPPAA